MNYKTVIDIGKIECAEGRVANTQKAFGCLAK